MDYIKNEQLRVILPEWKGNPLEGKEFQYIDQGFKPEFKTLFKMLITPNPQRQEKKKDTWRLDASPDTAYFTDKSMDWIAWLGHATFLIQLDGVRMVTDPVFYSLPFLSRKVEVPFDLDLLKDIDYILLSHDHRDHCDEKSFKQILGQNNPTILTSLRMNSVIRNWIGDTTFQEAGWFQEFQTGNNPIRITYLPAQHWCRRGLTDFNLRLWGSFMIEANGKTIYFGADSGSGAHFNQIGELFPNIDIAILGVGAYKPAFMMSDIHTSPEEAYEAFQQLGAKKMIPMHYGTFDLSNEPISEPYHLIQECFKKDAIEDRLLLCGVNEPLFL